MYSHLNIQLLWAACIHLSLFCTCRHTKFLLFFCVWLNLVQYFFWYLHTSYLRYILFHVAKHSEHVFFTVSLWYLGILLLNGMELSTTFGIQHLKNLKNYFQFEDVFLFLCAIINNDNIYLQTKRYHIQLVYIVCTSSAGGRGWASKIF